MIWLTKSGGRGLEVEHMDFSKFWIPVLVMTVIYILKDRFPKSWERIHAPILMVCSVLTMLLVCVLLVAAYVMVFHRTYSTGGKIQYCLVIAVMVGLLAGLNIFGWIRRKRDRREKK